MFNETIGYGPDDPVVIVAASYLGPFESGERGEAARLVQAVREGWFSR
ncbi:MAG: hypothetical protein RIB52_04480 [Erythrobacter sp.]